MSFSISRSRPYPLKKPFPLGNEEGKWLNLQVVFLIIGKEIPMEIKNLIHDFGKDRAVVGNH